MSFSFSNRAVRILALAACGIGAVKVIQAFNPQPDPPGFALIGFNPASQYAQLNVSNVPIPGISLGGACNVKLTFGDGNGNTFKTELVALGQGKSTSLNLALPDLPPPTTNLAPNPRVEALPDVQHDGVCFLTSSLEIVDTSTGHTSAYASHPVIIGNHNETLLRDSD